MTTEPEGPIGTATALVASPSLLARARKSESYWSQGWHRLRRDRLSMIALVVIAVIALSAAAAPLISSYLTGYTPEKIDLDSNYGAPMAGHWFGTDEYGRDYLTRTIWAARVSLTVGVGVAVVALVIGVTLGLLAGFYGGLVDDGINALVNTFLSLPGVFVLILVATLVPMTVLTLAVAIGVLAWMGPARQVRGVVLSAKRRDYVEAARALGASNRRIMWRHILPNVSSIVIVTTGFEVASGILAESALSFLSLGARPPDASWGNMLTNSIAYVNKAPWLVVFPGLFIFLTVLCIFLFSDGLRDALDPRLRR